MPFGDKKCPKPLALFCATWFPKQGLAPRMHIAAQKGPAQLVFAMYTHIRWMVGQLRWLILESLTIIAGATHPDKKPLNVR